MASAPSYGTTPGATRHGDETNATPLVAVRVLALPAAVVVGVVVGPPSLLLVAAAVVVAIGRRRRAAAALLGGSCWRAASWAHEPGRRLSTGATGEWSGRAVVMSDPAPRGRMVQTVLEIDGERYLVWAAGSPARRLAPALLGDTVEVTGRRVALEEHPAWLVARHVVGEFEIETVSDRRPGRPVTLAANRLRQRLEHGARTLPDADRALFAGLVYGDDRLVAPAVVEDFRAAGLSHLTAVSGQNVALVLTALGPLLRRLSPWSRWAVTVGAIAWFALLTRFEPSVLRASVMAGLAATAFVTGRERSGIGLLALALTGLVLVDPLLVWSVGLWLSAGATAGLAVLAAPIERHLPGPRWFRSPASAALAAQIGVLPVSGLVFGLPSVVSLPANLVAVPIAGAVMLAGFPVALTASLLPDALAALVQLPCLVAVRAVATVARIGAALDPPVAVDATIWLLIAVALVARVRRRTAADQARLGDS